MNTVQEPFKFRDNKPVLPAEWSLQRAVLIAWPVAEQFGPHIDETTRTYVTICQAITQFERVVIAVRDEAIERLAVMALSGAGIPSSNVTYVQIPYDDIWVRDTAPLGLLGEGQLVLADFAFNAWGGKYAASVDANFGRHFALSGALGRSSLDEYSFVLEGGSIETDGAGTLMTTSRCLLNSNRNSGASKSEVERVLRSALSIERVFWLDHGHVAGDDTDAHIDTLARFCDPKTVAYTSCDDPLDPHYQPLMAMRDELLAFRTAAGQPYDLVALPIPAPIFDESGRRLAATYANFLIINGAILLPTYDDPNDSVAAARLAACFADREIISIDCRALIRQNGSLHCMSMNYPA